MANNTDDNGVAEGTPLKPLVKEDMGDSCSYSEYTPAKSGDERGMTKVNEVPKAPPFHNS